MTSKKSDTPKAVKPKTTKTTTRAAKAVKPAKAAAKTAAKTPAKTPAKAAAKAAAKTKASQDVQARIAEVRRAQAAEGNFDCFATAISGYCDQCGCVYMEECLVLSRQD